MFLWVHRRLPRCQTLLVSVGLLDFYTSAQKYFGGSRTRFHDNVCCVFVCVSLLLRLMFGCFFIAVDVAVASAGSPSRGDDVRRRSVRSSARAGGG